MDVHAMAEAFADLGSTARSDAFAVAAARVWRAVQAHGFGKVLRTLATPERW